MAGNESRPKSWSRTQAYALAVICLFAGIGIGDWTRAQYRESAAKAQVVKPAIAHASEANTTMDPLKQESDRQAEPLLARLSQSPDDPLILAEIGKIYYQMRQFSIALKYYEDSVRIRPDSAVFVKLGGAYHFIENDDAAIRAWEHALRLDPNNPDALYNIGFVQWHTLGNRKDAISAWEQLLRTNPNHPERAQVEALLAQARLHPDTPMARKK